MTDTMTADTTIEGVVTLPPTATGAGAAGTTQRPDREREVVFDLTDVEVYYSGFRAVTNVTLDVARNEISAFIGPSGCGKTTVLRALNRMHDLTPGAEVKGKITYHREDLYGSKVDPAEVRRRIGMVFQKSNPFPKTIFENVAYGIRINAIAASRADMHERVEASLKAAAIWDEVKDRLHDSALALSGGQQQRLCIARALAVKPEILLMDEPASALDPIATQRIEELIYQLKTEYTIVIVTHNMQQAARVSDRTAFFWLGRLVEYGATEQIFTNPAEKLTEDYVTGRFG